MRETMKKTPPLLPLAAVSSALLLTGCGPELYDESTTKPAKFEYQTGTAQCDAKAMTGQPGIVDEVKSSHGLSYNLRTPSNYDATHAHPLLVVFSPAGTSAKKSERFTGLTQKATASGFIIAYTDRVQLSLETLEQLGKIPNEIASQWCVDKQRIYYTGHSDGGTVTTALSFMEHSRGVAAAIAPSAAGMTGKDLAEQSCPPALSVMVMHNSDDSHFPGYGKEAANWWANCNRCDQTPQPSPFKECVEYQNCDKGVRTLFCEKPGSHSVWPHLNDDMLTFLKAQSKD